MVDQSIPDTSELDRGRPLIVEAAWYWLGQPLVKWLPWSCTTRILLTLFGARIGTRVSFRTGLKVKFPWYLIIGDGCSIGEDVWIDNLAPVTLCTGVSVSSGVYLCTGNHDWSSGNMRLFCRPITLNDGCAIGAKAVVCPGVTVGRNARLTAGSIASRDIAGGETHTGNPATLVSTSAARLAGVR